MNNNFQRIGSVSNTQVGDDFESEVFALLSKQIDGLQKPFAVDLGIQHLKKHKFDMGCENPPVIVECKSHTWTTSGNVPSAKMTTWDQAMLYFHLSPAYYRKIFVVKKDYNEKRKETLCEYYLRTHSNLIPYNVEFWEYDTVELQQILTNINDQKNPATLL
jgi:hypothetical protein